MGKFDKYGSPFIRNKLFLRPVEKTDLEAIMKYWNTYETRQYLGVPLPHSTKQEEEWIQTVDLRAKQRKGFTFSIIEKETKEYLGSVSIESINWIDRTGTFGIAIHNPKNHNKGYGTDATLCILNFAFLILNMNRVELEVFAFNERAIHVYKKLGFKEVGRKRKAKFHEGEYKDIILMDILAEEFLQ